MPQWPPPPDELATPFIEAIVRGWGLRFRCHPCAETSDWSDVTLVERFLTHLDQPMSILRGRVSCPKCGDKERLIIHAINSGSMNWKTPPGMLSDALKVIEARRVELREMAARVGRGIVM